MITSPNAAAIGAGQLADSVSPRTKHAGGPEGGQALGISPRLDARPSFDGLGSDMAMAPPDGFEPPTPALGRLRSIH